MAQHTSNPQKKTLRHKLLRALKLVDEAEREDLIYYQTGGAKRKAHAYKESPYSAISNRRSDCTRLRTKTSSRSKACGASTAV